VVVVLEQLSKGTDVRQHNDMLSAHNSDDTSYRSDFTLIKPYMTLQL